ncbi:hypothetical protein Hypma_009531 [Hypsizygus marmoreus]|uniref:Uncharacterized protein n=1 Tax=Hypsizygus marmoreus TaxID=39966 RepID=A0A369JWC8_HYPMA|nr:hypothetical protein Hypma_009531 [Hypsizygus marmoreus]
MPLPLPRPLQKSEIYLPQGLGFRVARRYLLASLYPLSVSVDEGVSPYAADSSVVYGAVVFSTSSDAVLSGNVPHKCPLRTPFDLALPSPLTSSSSSSTPKMNGVKLLGLNLILSGSTTPQTHFDFS